MKRFGLHLESYLKAVSQAFFLDHAVFGAALLLLFAPFSRLAFFSAVLASAMGYVISVTTPTPKALKHFGLIPINGFFFGIALSRMHEPGAEYWIFLTLGSAVIPILTKAAYEVLQHWHVGVFVFPYILAIWVASLCSGALPQMQWMPDPDAIVTAATPGSAQIFVFAILHSISRLLFIASPWFGFAVWLLLTAFSPRRGFFFILGTAVGVAVSSRLADPSEAWQLGTLSYSAGLVALGLASFPDRFRFGTILAFSVLSVFVTLATERLLSQLQLPGLSLPYVLTVWTAMLSRSPRFTINWSARRPPEAAPVVLQSARAKVQEMEEMEEAA